MKSRANPDLIQNQCKCYVSVVSLFNFSSVMKSFLIEDILRPEKCSKCDLIGQQMASGQQRKSRRNRTVFTERQLIGLEQRFDCQKYLSVRNKLNKNKISSLIG